ncbi:hypothetical protein [Pseudomonas salmasensis]|uniref:hypothetical protein n=1 Tax=Pseudomonas salmasensis TaxID=2745514 RepID=UPI001648229B|nr:hypothetical protein [Pseudomonas salmasensis]QXH75627.1 hypothetical protein HU731_014205 [Pseudomonas salmasensis]
MSSVKEYLFEVEQDRFLAWAGDRLNAEDVEESSEAYQALAQEYSDMMDAYDEEAQYRWLERQSFHDQYIEFDTELRRAVALLSDSEHGSHLQMMCKLLYAHVVTLLEAMISTSVQALIVRDKKFLLNISRQIETFNRGKKFTLAEIAEHPKGVEGVVLKSLSEMTFHNPTTIKTVLCALIGDHMKDLDISPMIPISRLRHDIVHRNGRTVDDEPIVLESREVFLAMHDIDAFASDISRRIRQALDDMDEKL